MDSRRPGPGGEIDLGGVSSKMEICSLFMFLLLFEEALFENMQRAFLFKLQKANILPAKNFEIFRHLQLFHLSNTEIYFLMRDLFTFFQFSQKVSDRNSSQIAI